MTAETTNTAVLFTGRKHDLKCWPEPFAAIRAGLKHWELRLNDRDYQVGDLLWQKEWDPETEAYTGEATGNLVIWMLCGPAFGLPEGYVIMSLDQNPALANRDPQAGEAVAWRPIETHDGRPGKCLIVDPRWGVTEAMLFESGSWGLATFNGQVMGARPTHWMPLPAFPREGEAPARELARIAEDARHEAAISDLAASRQDDRMGGAK